MPDPISPISQLMTPTASAASGTDAMGKDTFLKLLVAQLKYQNPTSPVDASQFVSQSAQFSVVEKLDEIAKQATETLAAQWAAVSAGYLGRVVKGTGPDGKPLTGEVTGVRLEATGPILELGKKDLPVGMVEEVSLSSPAPASTTANSPAKAASSPTTTTGNQSTSSSPAPAADPTPTV